MYADAKEVLPLFVREIQVTILVSDLNSFAFNSVVRIVAKAFNGVPAE